jgi:uracil-DNA glycosylase
MNQLLTKIINCKVCEEFLEFGVNPIIAAGAKSKIVIVGQAPGRIVHKTKIPWNDKSGDKLRSWLGIEKSVFYNTDKVALMPMGFCYPGTGKNGDLPPRPECAPLWHPKLLALMPNIEIVLLIGQYAQNFYLGTKAKNTLTETVQDYKSYLPEYFPLPHPSPRNNIWLSRNEWFSNKVLPELKDQIHNILN